MVEQKIGNRIEPHARHKYIEEHKAEIIDSFLAGGYDEVKRVWAISSAGWYTTKKRWAADIEARRFVLGIADVGHPEKKTERQLLDGRPLFDNGKFTMTVSEDDLAIMTDDEFDSFWLWLGKVVRRRARTKTC